MLNVKLSKQGQVVSM